jgi:cellulose synthase/poly-beta-1,6-N-acetylglucosamine synthase-like glycosyltransferase
VSTDLLSRSTLATPILGVVLVLWFVLNGWVNYNSWLIWLAWRLRAATPERPQLPATLPRVTVQLPVFNEETVIVRLLEAVGRLEWPADRLEIQLLDDSIDRTPALAAPVIEALRARGLTVAHIRRADRTGYKAGALRDALPAATGEFILILDADFVPAPDLLQRLIPWFADPRLAMVQGRWGPLTRAQGIIERSAGFWIDRHFLIEQLARSRSGQFFHFNGSAGVWRRTAIDDSGGWTADTLAEDLDLTFRAWQRDWHCVYDYDTVIPAEVPATVAALRVQQSRWARGAFQVARKAIPRLGPESWRDRITIALHLTGYAFPVLMLALALTAGVAAWARPGHPVLAFFAVDLPMVGFFIGMVVQSYFQGWKGGWRRGWLEIEAAAVGIGMAPLVFKAGAAGLLRYGGEFRRTPKSTRATGQLPPMVFVETGLGIACAASATWAVIAGAPWAALLPVLAASGLLTLAWRTVRP